MGEWEYPLIYGFKEDAWEALLTRWRDAVGQWKAGDREGPRTLVEAGAAQAFTNSPLYHQLQLNISRRCVGHELNYSRRCVSCFC